MLEGNESAEVCSVVVKEEEVGIKEFMSIVDVLWMTYVRVCLWCGLMIGGGGGGGS